MILRADHLIKNYKARTVVNDMSVTVEQGEIVGLLGPNGAGKTTCFYMMVGMVKPNSGRIYLDDDEITKMPMYQRARRGVGYLAQEASVFRDLTRRGKHPGRAGNDRHAQASPARQSGRAAQGV